MAIVMWDQAPSDLAFAILVVGIRACVRRLAGRIPSWAEFSVIFYLSFTHALALTYTPCFTLALHSTTIFSCSISIPIHPRTDFYGHRYLDYYGAKRSRCDDMKG